MVSLDEVETDVDKTTEARKQYMIEWRAKNAARLAAYNEKRRNDPKRKEKQRELYWKNRDKRIAQLRESRNRRPIEVREQYKKYRNNNKDLAYQRTRDWRDRNRDKIAAYSKVYRRNNADKIREYQKGRRKEIIATVYAWNAERRARINKAKATGYDRQSVIQIYEMARRVSQCTGIPHDVDHHIPLSKGGPHHQHNLRVIPHKLNIRKSAKMPLTA